MKKIIVFLVFLLIITVPICLFAITPRDNGNMNVTSTSGGLELSGDLKGFDIKGYIVTDESTGRKQLISSTYSNYGYHTFLNVNGKNGNMNEILKNSEDGTTWENNAIAMEYKQVTGDGIQDINGIQLHVDTDFINDGEQLQITYTLKNTTHDDATISLATCADVQIDGDDKATIERLDDGSGVRLWTKDGHTDKPVQFVFYGRNVDNTTNIDTLWIGGWSRDYLKNMFTDNSDKKKIENQDSSFCYSWTNKEIKAGETKKYSVLMEVGEINVPNTGLTLEDNKKFYYTDVKFDGTVTDKDLRDKITIHYIVDDEDYTLEPMNTTGGTETFTLDLTNLNLSTDKVHTLKVWATDATGCESNTVERKFTVTYLKNPELSVSEEGWTKNDVTFKITDDVNVQEYVEKYQYRINNGDWKDCEKDKDIPIEENGLIQVDARIVGTKPEDYSDIVTKNTKIDRIPPTDTQPTVKTTTHSITVTLGQIDEHSGIDSTKTRYQIKKGDQWSDWQEGNVFDGLTPNTEYVIKTQATDMVGNTSESEELKVKTEELLIGDLILKFNNDEGENYTENSWSNQDIYATIEEKTEGVTTSYYSKENSAEKIESTSQPSTLTEEGTTTLLLSATDGFNVVTSEVEHPINIDKVKPNITSVSLDNAEWSKFGKNIIGKAKDNLSGVSAYQVSNQNDITASSPGWIPVPTTNEEVTENVSVEETGTYYFYFKDEAENIASISIDAKIDVSGPVITFDRANGKTVINYTDMGSGINTKQYAWTTEDEQPSEDEWKTYSSAVTYDGESKDTIYLWARATDNVDNETVECTVFSPIKEPTIISDDEFIERYVCFKLNSDNEDDDVIYQFKIDDGQWQTVAEDNLYTVIKIFQGELKITARVLDNAGRYSEEVTKTVKATITKEPVNPGTGNLPQGDGNGQGGNGSGNGSGSGSGSSNGSLTKIKNQDKSVSKQKLPKTGINKAVIIILVIIMPVSVFALIKFVSYRDVK